MERSLRLVQIMNYRFKSSIIFKVIKRPSSNSLNSIPGDNLKVFSNHRLCNFGRGRGVWEWLCLTKSFSNFDFWKSSSPHPHIILLLLLYIFKKINLKSCLNFINLFWRRMPRPWCQNHKIRPIEGYPRRYKQHLSSIFIK